LDRQTPSLPDARPHSDRFRCGGRESEFLADRQTGIASIQSMYAPEFNSHSESITLEVK
jgi:hypothetical protein